MSPKIVVSNALNVKSQITPKSLLVKRCKRRKWSHFTKEVEDKYFSHVCLCNKNINIYGI